MSCCFAAVVAAGGDLGGGLQLFNELAASDELRLDYMLQVRQSRASLQKHVVTCCEH
jgi:hypothetical protein